MNTNVCKDPKSTGRALQVCYSLDQKLIKASCSLFTAADRVMQEILDTQTFSPSSYRLIVYLCRYQFTVLFCFFTKIPKWINILQTKQSANSIYSQADGSPHLSQVIQYITFFPNTNLLGLILFKRSSLHILRANIK